MGIGIPRRAFRYLVQAEALFLDAAVDCLIPADELGPGAKEADVTLFIDRQLVSIWGVSARKYRTGPWPEGTPQQGDQCRLTPQEVYRSAIQEIDEYCSQHLGNRFSLLKREQQVEVLSRLESDLIPMETCSAKYFFEMLLLSAKEGFFSDPIHGGNKDKIGWKLIGFPGVASFGYSANLNKEFELYRVEPVSILDVCEGRIEVNAQGYPKHTPLVRKD